MKDPHTQQVTQVPLLDVNRGNQLDAQAIQDAIKGVTDSGRFLFGPDCQKLEESIAKLCYVDHAIGCASGSDALLLSLMALGIGPGDEVALPSFTFFATASAVTRLGARPVFVDIDRQTFNMDPTCLREVITSATKAVIPVHLFGQCAEMEEICSIATDHDLHVIEDAAQAIGARCQGRPAGSWGDVGCFSFYPTKNLGGFGDGGMLVTGYSSLADELRLLACHGMRPRYYHSVVGINSRLDSIQAAVLNVKLERLAEATIKRQANAQRYRELFESAGLVDALVLPEAVDHMDHVWNQYTIRVPDGRRDALRSYLMDQQVGAEIYYPVPLHQQECFERFGYLPGDLPETELAAQEVLSLPIFPELEVAEQEFVVAKIGQFFAMEQSAAA